MIKLSTIKPNPNNPRVVKDAKFEKLCNSIKEFPEMFPLRPIVIDENSMILGGNMRFRALQHLGFKEVPEDWIKQANELTEEQKQRFIITDNVGFGEWDWDMLANEWNAEELKDWGMDMPVWENAAVEDIEEVEDFNEDCNFTIKCKNIEELEKLQTKLSTSAKKINYTEFILKAGL